MKRMKWFRPWQAELIETMGRKITTSKIGRLFLPQRFRLFLFWLSLPYKEAENGQRILLIKRKSGQIYAGKYELDGGDWDFPYFRPDLTNSRSFFLKEYGYWFTADWLDNITGRLER
jgi:hypothetical protein